MTHRRKKTAKIIGSLIIIVISFSLIMAGVGALWLATLKMPDLHSFSSRKKTESTKIYDRTGEILLYDAGINARKTVVPLNEISSNIQNATIAIEDSNFYKNIGIEPLSILRAVLADVTSGEYQQGASTITQQVVKNSLLTQDKTITRKIKEWVIAIKLTNAISKEEILETYLNETPYGGTIYGVEEASRSFFGKSAKDVSLGEASYLAAIVQRPTYYSPYGLHREELDKRRKLVLNRMQELGMIDSSEYEKALAEKVQFLSRNDGSIRAPHFVMMVREYITQKYGEEQLSQGGLKIITTLDFSMQQKAEDVVDKFSPTLATNFNASNTAMVAIDPKTGDILTLIGSKDYFNEEIDGNYNVAMAKRQPGSTFKPFVYATLFEKGYTPETILFDTETEFSTRCTIEGKPKNPTDDVEKVCYSPDEYDHNFEGPMTIRKALAQSRNIPAVKALYLAGISDSIKTSTEMGITSLTDPNRYGLTLVLGGGEVSLLDITSAYSVFANDGMRNPYRMILKIEDTDGKVLEEATTNPVQVISKEAARQISNILSDESVRMNSLKPIAESTQRQVAIKTGTTNDYRDVWTIGYTPNIVVGAWAGNNDNIAMHQNVAGLIISPLWGAFMSQVAPLYPSDNFVTPPAPLTEGKTVLRGIWQGGISYKKDRISGKLATEYTPIETQEEIVFDNVHTILHWLNKDDPRGAIPSDPKQDSQYEYWEYGVRKWFDNWKTTHPEFTETTNVIIPTEKDDVHVPEKTPTISIISPENNSVVEKQSILNINIKSIGTYPIKKTEVYLNGKYVMTDETSPLSISFVPSDFDSLSDNNTIDLVIFDSVYNKVKSTLDFRVK